MQPTLKAEMDSSVNKQELQNCDRMRNQLVNDSCSQKAEYKEWIKILF